MNKYGWLFFATATMILTNMIAQQISITASAINSYSPDDMTASIGTVTGFFGTYWQLITFSLSGVPAFVSTFFLILNIVIIYIVLELVIKAVDAIIPF